VWFVALSHWHVSSSNRQTASHEWIRDRCQFLVPSPRCSFFDYIEWVVALFQPILRFGNSRNFLTALRSFTCSPRYVQHALRRFSRNSQMLSGIVCRSRIPNFTQTGR
jgi:hypothetical protein